MSNLKDVLAKAKKILGKEDVAPKKKVKKNEGCGSPRMMKAINAANNILDDSSDRLEKGVFDAMAHHHQHAQAADSARWQCPEDKDGSKSKKCSDHAKKHSFMFARHALEQARKRASSSWDVGNKMKKYMSMFDDEYYNKDNTPDHDKIVDHYKGGGDFKGHKDDKFKEDY